MYNIRIKQLPDKAKTGSQLDYGLVDRNTLFLKTGVKEDSEVKTTMSAVPKEEANVEAEGGETVVGDINNDGYLEHQKIVGKKHSQGGVPLNIPQGSFIFSDTKKMKIKDPEVLSIFGLTPRSQGHTPADIAKRYDITKYMAILKNDEADVISKDTAQTMVDSNLKKLGMLALVQESMKGFPDGVPAIAESIVAGMQGETPEQESAEGPQEEQSEESMQVGGQKKPEALNGNTQQTTTNNKVSKNINENFIEKSGLPRVGYTVYRGIHPVTVSKVELDYGIDNPEGDFIKLSDGTKINRKNFDNLRKTGVLKGSTNREFNDIYTSTPRIDRVSIKDDSGNNVGLDLYSGDKLRFKDKDYEVIDPLAEGSRTYNDSWKSKRDFLDNTHGVIKVRYVDEDGSYKIKYLEGEDIGNAYKFDKSLVNIQPHTAFRAKYKQQYNTTVSKPTTLTPQVAEQKKVNTTPVIEPAPQAKPQIVTTPVNNTQKQVNKSARKAMDTIYSDEEFAYGGTYNPYFQSGGEKKEIDHYEVSKITGNKRAVYKDGTNGPIIEQGTTYDVADEELRNIVKAKNYGFIDLKPEFRYKQKTVGPQTHKTGYMVDPDSGFLYKDIKPGAAGLANYMEIHKEAIDAYPGGATAWKKTMLDNAGKINPAMTHLLNYENNFIGKLSGNRNYVDLTKRGALVPGVENFNLPGISKLPNDFEAETPVVNQEKKIIAPERPVQPYRARDRGWWLQDRVNFAGAMTDDVHKYNPYMSNIDAVVPDYVLNDPTRQLAANQEQQARMNDSMFGSTAGNVAGASMLGNSGEGLANAATILANVENSNVGIVNQAYANAAQIYNNAEALNENAKQKYVEDMAVGNQQYDNARNQLKWRQIAAFNNGQTNWTIKKQMENILFPQVNIDPLNGDVDFTGARGRMNDDGTFPLDTYQNPIMSGRNLEVNTTQLYNSYIKAGKTHQEAIDLSKLYIMNKQKSVTPSLATPPIGYGASFDFMGGDS